MVVVALLTVPSAWGNRLHYIAVGCNSCWCTRSSYVYSHVDAPLSSRWPVMLVLGHRL